MDDDDYERILSVKNEVFVYKIPPRQSSRAYRAADWKLDQPDWTGRLRIVVVNNKCIVKMEDKTSGELFAEAPIDQYPGPAVESVSDSSRYFVLKIVDVSGRHAFIGIGFADRGDSFDFSVTLQDHFKRGKNEEELTTAPQGAPLDLSFKEGQTIKINIGSRTGEEARARPKRTTGGGGLLPPPPSGNIPKLAPVPGSRLPQQSVPSGGAPQQPVASVPQQPPMQPSSQPVQQSTNAEWGDFESLSSPGTPTSKTWVQF